MNSKHHNGIISFWKFAFCILIIGFHLNAKEIYLKNNFGFLAGSIGVEFFFIVSGYLICKKANEVICKNRKIEIGIETKNFIFNFIKVIFPYLLISYIVTLVFNNCTETIEPYKNIKSIFDVLFLYSSGIKYSSIIWISWYVAALLIGKLIIYPLILKYNKAYNYIIAPISIFIIIGYLGHEYGALVNVETWTGITTAANLRALLDLNLGILAYSLSERIRNINFNPFGKMLITFLEYTAFILIFIMIQEEGAHFKYDFIMIFILMLAIALAFSEKNITLRLFNNKFFYFLEKLSLPMFLNQVFVMKIVRYIIENNHIKIGFYKEFVLVIALSIVFAICTLGIVKAIKLISKRFKKIIITN